MDSSTHTLLVVFVSLTGVSVFLQVCAFVIVIVALRKMTQTVLHANEDLKETVIPALHSTREMLERISPQVTTIAGGFVDLTQLLHTEAKGVRISVAEIMERFSRQTARVDRMLTTGLDSVEKAGATIESAVAVPVRQANGIVAAIKAIVSTYQSTIPRRKPAYDELESHERAFDPEI